MNKKGMASGFAAIPFFSAFLGRLDRAGVPRPFETAQSPKKGNAAQFRKAPLA